MSAKVKNASRPGSDLLDKSLKKKAKPAKPPHVEETPRDEDDVVDNALGALGDPDDLAQQPLACADVGEMDDVDDDDDEDSIIPEASTDSTGNLVGTLVTTDDWTKKLAAIRRAKELSEAANAKEYIATAMRRAGATATASITGVVVGVRSKKVQSKDDPKKKVDMTAFTIMPIELHKNGATDIIDGGNGMVFMLPTKVVDDLQSDNSGSGKRKKLAVDEDARAIFMGMLDNVSFYISDANYVAITKLKVGSKVRVNGLAAKLSPNGGLYLNARDVVSLDAQDVAPWLGARAVMDYASDPVVQSNAALLLSQTIGGFFDSKEIANRDTKDEAGAFARLWESTLAQTALALESRELALVDKRSDENLSNAAALRTHAQRLRSVPAKDVALGVRHIFEPATPQTEDNFPNMAPLVFDPLDTRIPMPKLVMDVLDGAPPDRLPTAFCAPSAREVIIDTSASALVGVQVQFRYMIPGKRKPASDLLDSGVPAMALKFLLRDIATLFGVFVCAPLSAFVRDALVYGRWFATAGVAPRGPNDDQPPVAWGRSPLVDMYTTTGRVAFLVEESFLKMYLSGGEQRYEYDANSVHGTDDRAYVCDKNNNNERLGTFRRPTLTAHGYQCLNGDSDPIRPATFKFGPSGSTLPPGSAGVEYRVWFNGVVRAVKDVANEDRNVLNDAPFAHEAILQAARDKYGAAADRAGETEEECVGRFLARDCLVYCVAIPKA
jgi:hypothetical protein